MFDYIVKWHEKACKKQLVNKLASFCGSIESSHSFEKETQYKISGFFICYCDREYFSICTSDLHSCMIKVVGDNIFLGGNIDDTVNYSDLLDFLTYKIIELDKEHSFKNKKVKV